uniref:Uncharacterized protein n=1 Tax=Leersia perrieri TaxID=77586 RepID=A0A0D9XSY3_9ORYZ
MTNQVSSCATMVVVVVVAGLVLLPLAAGDLLGKVCGGGGYRPGDAYGSNLDMLLNLLHDSIVSMSYPYFQHVGIDTIYAVALCRGDATDSTDCLMCLSAAAHDARTLCRSSMEATVYHDVCFLSYSSSEWDYSYDQWSPHGFRYAELAGAGTTIFTEPSFPGWNPSSDAHGAIAIRRFVLASLEDTARWAALNTSERYATGRFDGHGGVTLYSLAQCTPDLATGDCWDCLQGLLNRMTEVFAGLQGGWCMSVRCGCRYETYPFYGGASTLLNGWPDVAVTTPMDQDNSTHILINKEDIQLMESLKFDLSTLKAATNNFDECNKLGEGGFGVVYKGTLSNGQVIAVKKLSHTSQQGIDELTNEIVLIGKLQHRNLDRSNVLDWVKRFKIISETARGLQYLHEESRLRIIHRDLKPTTFFSTLTCHLRFLILAWQSYMEGINHIGYMAPEYAMCGQYSVKSDVFSFGVIVLEIVTGRRSMGSYNYEQPVSPLGVHWSTGTVVDLVDPSLLSNISSSQQCSDRDQMLRCIHIGLLCVQENPADRPKLSSVIEMLRSSSTTPLQSPSRPGFWVHSVDAPPCSSSSGGDPAAASANHVSVTELEARILWNHRDGKYMKTGTYETIEMQM